MRQQAGRVLGHLGPGGRTDQPVVQIRQDLHALRLQGCEGCRHNPGENPRGEGKPEGKYPELVMPAPIGKPQEPPVVWRNRHMKIGVLQVYGRKPLPPGNYPQGVRRGEHVEW